LRIELTIKVEVSIKAWLSNTGDEDTKAISISEGPNGNNDTNQCVISGKLWHRDGCVLRRQALTSIFKNLICPTQALKALHAPGHLYTPREKRTITGGRGFLHPWYKRNRTKSIKAFRSERVSAVPSPVCPVPRGEGNPVK
jgi:hypothetical protein